MRRVPFFAWLLLFLYALWIFALQGVLAGPHGLGAWTPDLGLVFLLALGARIPAGRAPFAALVIALARSALAADPPLSLGAGYLGVAGFAGLLRSSLEIDRPLGRTLLAGLSALMLSAFWIAAGALARSAGAGSQLAGEAFQSWIWPGAAASALGAFLLAPLLGRLPGLRPLRRREP
jgi:hypothetical protein